MLAATNANRKRRFRTRLQARETTTKIFCTSVFFISTMIRRPSRQASFTYVNYCVLYNYKFGIYSTKSACTRRQKWMGRLRRQILWYQPTEIFQAIIYTAQHFWRVRLPSFIFSKGERFNERRILKCKICM